MINSHPLCLLSYRGTKQLAVAGVFLDVFGVTVKRFFSFFHFFPKKRSNASEKWPAHRECPKENAKNFNRCLKNAPPAPEKKEPVARNRSSLRTFVLSGVPEQAFPGVPLRKAQCHVGCCHAHEGGHGHMAGVTGESHGKGLPSMASSTDISHARGETWFIAL